MKDRLAEKERAVAGLAKETDLIAVLTSADKSVDDKAAVLFTAIKERDAQIHHLQQSNGLQLRRIQTLEQQQQQSRSEEDKKEEGKEDKKDKETPTERLVRESMSPGGGMGSPSTSRKTR